MEDLILSSRGISDFKRSQIDEIVSEDMNQLSLTSVGLCTDDTLESNAFSIINTLRKKSVTKPFPGTKNETFQRSCSLEDFKKHPNHNSQHALSSCNSSSTNVVTVNEHPASQAVFDSSPQKSDASSLASETVSTNNEFITSDGIFQDDFTTEKWKQQKKHIFILSRSGKPIYSRYGDEDSLATLMGVMQALVSFVENVNDQLKYITAGEHRFVFLPKQHVILVCVMYDKHCSADTRPGTITQYPISHINLALKYMYNLLLSILTYASIDNTFKQRQNFDLRRYLRGSERLFCNMLDMIDEEFGIMLNAVRCLPLPQSTRDAVSHAIVHGCKIQDLVFGVILANNRLVSLVRMKRIPLNSQDLHIIINFVMSSESLKTGETWSPICLPNFDAAGFLYAYITYLNEVVCLLLFSVDRMHFDKLQSCKTRILERMNKSSCLQQIAEAYSKCEYPVSVVGVPDMRHFLIQHRSFGQYTCPQFTCPFVTSADFTITCSDRDSYDDISSELDVHRDRVIGHYRRLHYMMHSAAHPLKVIYERGDKETYLAVLNNKQEMYTVFSPFVTKSEAMLAASKLLKWLDKEEYKLFMHNSSYFL